jgi:uncharacterized membrane protein
VQAHDDGLMNFAQAHYLPLPLPFFSILIGLLVVLIALVQIEVLHYAYSRLGVSSAAVLLLLAGSLIGSYFNIPVAQLSPERVLSAREVAFFGMRYVVPAVANWPGTVIAVNVGGAVIPTLMSIYLLTRQRLWLRGIVGTACVAAVCYQLARPTHGVGVALPIFVPSIVTAVVAWLLARERAAALAYISGSLGTLIGADLLNLPHVRGLGAPIAAIGGAGTFDGIFLIGILSVLLAGLGARPGRRARSV